MHVYINFYIVGYLLTMIHMLKCVPANVHIALLFSVLYFFMLTKCFHSENANDSTYIEITAVLFLT